MGALLRRPGGRVLRAAASAALVLAIPVVARGQQPLRVAVSGDYAPFAMAAEGAEIGEVHGFDVEVARRFAADRGYRVEFVRFAWTTLRSDLVAGGFDVAMSGITVKTDRAIAGRFSVPVAITSAVALTWKGSGTESLADLDREERRVAVNAGGHLESVARRTFSKATVVAIADNDAVRMGLLDRAYDAVVSDVLEAPGWAGDRGDAVRIPLPGEDRKAYLLPASRGELAAELDAWLLQRERDGTLGELRRRHFPAEAQGETATTLAALVQAIDERLSLMEPVYEAKRRAKLPIADPAREREVIAAAEAAVREAAARAARPEPAASDVHRLFSDLIEAGKDIQERLESEDRARLVRFAEEKVQLARAEKNASAERERSADAAETQTAPPVAAEPDPPPSAVIPDRGPRYDLAGELRPAIDRATDKIARLLVMLDQPASVAAVRALLLERLAPYRLVSGHADIMAEAIARISQEAH